jgi:hypothetical protein
MRMPTSTFASLFACVAAFTAAGCDPGSVGGGDDDDTGPGPGPGVDKLVCSAGLTLAGTFAVGTVKPAEISGCWPIGTWTFTATVGSSDCSTAPTPLPQYQVKIDRDLTSTDPDYTWTYSYLTDPNDMTAHVGVTSGGGGLCEGEVLIYSADGKTVWNMHPALQADNSINGTGDYEVHTLNQVPQSDM